MPATSGISPRAFRIRSRACRIDGCEFLLAFPDGKFSEDSTFAITDTFAHMPKEVLAKNLGIDQKALANIPEGKIHFPGAGATGSADGYGGQRAGQSAARHGVPPDAAGADTSPGGWVRIADTRNFAVSTDVSGALVEVNPGHMREIHWHPLSDEWQYYIAGKGRMTVFAAQGNARTFDFLAGDVGYVPRSMPHYIENTGTEPLRFLELFNSPRFADVSLTQWMALTPHELVAEHLDINKDLIDALPKDKRPVV